MNKEIKDLTTQRDLAQFHVESLLKSVEDDQNAGKHLTLASSASLASPSRRRQSKDFGQPDEYSPSRKMLQMTECPEDDFLLDNSTPKFTGLDLCESWEDIAQRNDISSDSSCKDVQCIETRASSLNKNMGTEMLLPNSTPTSVENEKALTTMQKEESSVITYNALKQKVQELHQTINNLQQCPSETENSSSKGFVWARSNSRRSVLVTIPSILWSDNEDTNEPSKFEEECHDLIGHATKGNISRTQSQESLHNDFPEESMTTKVIDVEVDDTASILDLVGMNAIAAIQAEKGNANPLVVPEAYIKSNEKNGTSEFGREKHDINWSIELEGYQRKIIELWFKCNVSLVHRSCFFLFFKDDPSDNVYMEVELRRLQFLQNTFSCRNDTNKGIDSRIVTLSSSLKALNHERGMLVKQIQKKLTRKEKEDLYRKWNISLKSKRRSLKLGHLLWTDTSSMKHIKESAALVAKLVGLIEPLNVPKEMFGLCLSTPSMGRRSSRWRDNMSPLL